MTHHERYLAYARAMCRAYTLHAEADDEEADAAGLYPFGDEAGRALEVKRRRAAAGWARSMAAAFAATAEGRDDVPFPKTVDHFAASPAPAVSGPSTSAGAQQQ
jgi:hypothetical protein